MSKQEDFGRPTSHLKKRGKLIMRLKYQRKPKRIENSIEITSG